MSDDIKQVYRRFADAINHRDLDALHDIFDERLINHGADPDEPTGSYHFKQVFREFIAACPDLRIVIDDLLVDGDTLVVRWTDYGTHTGGPLWGVPSSGKSIVLTGIDILRISNGRIVERWSESDTLFVLKTLGIVSS